MRCLAALSFLAIVFCISSSQGYRILCALPYEGSSHFIMVGGLCKELAKRGHQIDMISHFPLKKPIANYTDVVDLSGTRERRMNNMSVEFVRNYNTANILSVTKEFGSDLCELMGEEKMQKFLKNPPNDPPYDLVLTEFFFTPCYFALGPYFNTQIAVAVAYLDWPIVNDFMGSPQNFAFVSGPLGKMPTLDTFYGRLYNFMTSHINIRRYFYYTSNHVEIARKYLAKDIPDTKELYARVPLILMGGHFSVQGVNPTIPGIIDVGGLHIEANESELTPELKNWLDSAQHGVVYFTLGSMITIETLPKETLESLYASFAKIAPTKVLLKAGNATKLAAGLPSNVVISSWVPQLSVLKHKHTRAFITHGGLLGFQEALYCGVPMIGIPLFADQFRNMQLMVEKNMGIVMHIDEITEQSMDAALNALLHDPKYKENAKKVSKLFRDRPMSPMDTAVYWIEYVIRNGPVSLRSQAADMPWWKLHLVDVFAFLITCFALSAYLLLVLSKFLLRRLRRCTVRNEKKLN